MIRLRAKAFGAFPEVERLNPAFDPGHLKLRLTVDTESVARLPDRELLARLTEAFPGVAGHRCQVGAIPADRPSSGPLGVALLEGESSANQAHFLEHLLLEIIHALEGTPRLSGVTCAYQEPRERNDIFVECADPRSGELAAPLAVTALNAALEGIPLAPLGPDAVRCARELRGGGARGWSAGGLAQRTGLPPERAGWALGFLTRAGVVEAESWAMNLSGETHYRLVLADLPAADAAT